MIHTVLVVINKDNGHFHLSPSETFLKAHIDGLPCSVTTLIGIRGKRWLNSGQGRFLQSRSFLPLALRWLIRKFGIVDISTQDRRALARYLRTEKISAVLAEYGPTAVSVMDACNDANVPLISHFHGWDAYSHYLLKLHKLDYKKLFRLSSAIIAVSLHMKEQLISLGAEREKIIHNACGAEIFDSLKNRQKKVEFHFVVLGRLTEKKAPFLSILSFSKIAKSHKGAQLDVIGDGPLMDSCKQLCKGLGIEKNVTFHGALPHDTALEIMAGARCFIQHSVVAPSGDREGTPVAVLEAMSMGLAVVCTRHGGINDIVEDGETGSLVNEYDVTGTAQAMGVYASDPQLATHVGEKARAKVLANWTKEKSVNRLWDVINASIAK